MNIGREFPARREEQRDDPLIPVPVPQRERDELIPLPDEWNPARRREPTRKPAQGRRIKC
jgi:hypothetical protein